MFSCQWRTIVRHPHPSAPRGPLVYWTPDFLNSFGQLSLPPLGILISPSAPLLDRNDVWRSEPTIALPLPRRSPILFCEDQLTPEGMLIPEGDSLLMISSILIYLLLRGVGRESREYLMRH